MYLETSPDSPVTPPTLGHNYYEYAAISGFIDVLLLRTELEIDSQSVQVWFMTTLKKNNKPYKFTGLSCPNLYNYKQFQS